LSTDDVLTARLQWLRDMGAPETEMTVLCGAPEEMERLRDMGLPDRLIADGERVLDGHWDLRAMWTPGHTPGHLCFRELGLGVLLSGDHLLPRITPNVSAGPFATMNPLGDYERSLTAVGAIADDVKEVWPAHEYRFMDPRERVGSLLDHHTHRMSEIRRCLPEGQPRTTWEVAERLTWSRGWDQTLGSYRRSALGETQAHLRLLAAAREIEPRNGTPQRWLRQTL
jgi:glyoxylase-like metal-dependent hydrolase (beta-lactamase superfamily II)